MSLEALEVSSSPQCQDQFCLKPLTWKFPTWLVLKHIIRRNVVSGGSCTSSQKYFSGGRRLHLRTSSGSRRFCGAIWLPGAFEILQVLLGPVLWFVVCCGRTSPAGLDFVTDIPPQALDTPCCQKATWTLPPRMLPACECMRRRWGSRICV